MKIEIKKKLRMKAKQFIKEREREKGRNETRMKQMEKRNR